MPDPVLVTGPNARSSAGYPILCFLSYIRSGTGYWIKISIYLYRVRYRIPGPVEYSFYWICCLIPDPVFYIYFWIQYWIPDFMPDPVLGTISYVFCQISDPVLGTRSQLEFIYTGSGTVYQILLNILFSDLLLGTGSCFFFYWVSGFLPDPVLDTGLNARSCIWLEVLHFV